MPHEAPAGRGSLGCGASGGDGDGHPLPQRKGIQHAGAQVDVAECTAEPYRVASIFGAPQPQHTPRLCQFDDALCLCLAAGRHLLGWCAVGDGCDDANEELVHHRAAARPTRMSPAGWALAWWYPVPAHKLTTSGSPAATPALRIGIVRWCSAG